MPSSSYSYTGGWQTFNVPTGVTSLTITMDGAGSGSRAGGRVSGTLAVADTDVLYIVVGGAGKLHSGSTAGGTSFGAGNSGGPGYSGGGSMTGNGGNGGGGYSAIRMNSTAGTIKCVAGGAGGDSGDSGAGGTGGGSTGGSGGRGTDGTGTTTVATGGTQSAGGNKGVNNNSGSAFDGNDASDTALGLAGAGGDTGGFYGHGGGGGGGGYHSGGGGNASSWTFAPGSGGGAGSNYVGGLTGSTNSQGGGGTGNGGLTITWVDPNQAPNTPTSVSPTTGTATKSTGTVTVTATVSDPDGGTVRMLVRRSTTSNFSSYTDTYSGYVTSGTQASVNLTGLSLNTLYYIRVFAQDPSGVFSAAYASSNFYTNRDPDVPTSVVPANNASTGAGPGVDGVLSVSATVSDADGGTVRALFRYSTVSNFATYTDVYTGYVNSGTTASTTISDLTTDTQYYLQVYAQDPQGSFSAATSTITFYSNRTPNVPSITKPAANAVLDSTIIQTFQWVFSDPDSGDTQQAAELRYRLVGDTVWTTITKTTAQSHAFSANTFTPNSPYEWQVRTADRATGNTVQLWSDWTTLRTVTLSPPVVNMTGSGGLTIVGTETHSPTNAMSAGGGLALVPTETHPYSLSMTGTAQFIPAPQQTIDKVSAMVGTASLNPVAIVTRQGTIPMTATAQLNPVGTDSMIAVLSMSASATQLTSIVQAEDLMRSSAVLSLIGSKTISVGVPILAGTATLITGPQVTHPASNPMAVSANLVVSSVQITHFGSLTMAANGAVVVSPALSRQLVLPISVRAVLSPTGLVSRIQANPMAARAVVGINTNVRPIAKVSMSAHSILTVSGFEVVTDQLALGANASLSIHGFRTTLSALALRAVASVLIAPGQQVVFEGPYKVVVLPNGQTLSFTLNSVPIPRKIGNDLSVINYGNVR